MSAPSTPDGKDAWPAVLLSFVAGYVDTFSFVVLFGLFTAHVTGNFVLIGAAFAGHGYAGVVAKLLALPVFIAGVGATHALQTRLRDPAGTLVLVQLAGLALFMACGLALAPLDDADAPATVLTGLLGVLTMAVQNAAARVAFARLSPTTVMTGNVTQVTIDAVDVAFGTADAATAARMGRMWPTVVAFGVGAIAAGLLCARLGFVALALPGAALMAVWWRLKRG